MDLRNNIPGPISYLMSVRVQFASSAMRFVSAHSCPVSMDLTVFSLDLVVDGMRLMSREGWRRSRSAQRANLWDPTRKH